MTQHRFKIRSIAYRITWLYVYMYSWVAPLHQLVHYSSSSRLLGPPFQSFYSSKEPVLSNSSQLLGPPFEGFRRSLVAPKSMYFVVRFSPRLLRKKLPFQGFCSSKDLIFCACSQLLRPPFQGFVRHTHGQNIILVPPGGWGGGGSATFQNKGTCWKDKLAFLLSLLSCFFCLDSLFWH